MNSGNIFEVPTKHVCKPITYSESKAEQQMLIEKFSNTFITNTSQNNEPRFAPHLIAGPSHARYV